MNRKDFINKVFVTNSFKETQKLGRDFGKVLEKGDLICLYGDLGSGKTTFVQGLAEGLGIKRRIISPTFIIVRSYKVENKKKRDSGQAVRRPELTAEWARMTDSSLLVFYHIDLYRIESERDLEGLGIEEIINNKNNIVTVEWAQNLKGFLPKKRIDIKFFYEKNNVRRITFSLTT